MAHTDRDPAYKRQRTSMLHAETRRGALPHAVDLHPGGHRSAGHGGEVGHMQAALQVVRGARRPGARRA